MKSSQQQAHQHNDEFLRAGIVSLTEATAPSWLEAVGAVIRQLGTEPDKVETRLENLPASERTAVKEFLRLAGHLPELSKQAYRALSGVERRISAADVVKLPTGPTSSTTWQDRAAYPIDLSKVIVIPKQSSLQYQMVASGKSLEGLLAEMHPQTADKLAGCHAKHLMDIAGVQKLLTPQQVLSQEEFCKNPTLINGASLVIALGGDDHFKLVTQAIDDETPVIGINSDPVNSRGFLLSATIDDLPALIKDLEAGQYKFEPWSRLRLSVDGRDIGPALDEIVIAQQSFQMTSRHLLEFDGKKAEHACSGLIIATGSGSTSWIDSAGLYIHPHGLRFPPSARCARFLLREPSRQWTADENGELRASLPELCEGLLPAGKTLKVRSLNRRGQAVIMRDSLQTTQFPRDSQAEIILDPKPLWVIKKAE